jgi:hypothetical protein
MTKTKQLTIKIDEDMAKAIARWRELYPGRSFSHVLRTAITGIIQYSMEHDDECQIN